MPEISPVRSRIKTPTVPAVVPEQISRCDVYLVEWCSGVTARTEAARMKDLRRFGRWQWNEARTGRILAWLLDLTADDASQLIAAFDRVEARTSSRLVRYRRLLHIRHALRFAAIREGRPIPKVAPPVKDAA